MRRAYLTAVGRIPTYEEAISFLDDEDPDKRTRLIDKLVGSDGFDMHMFNWWADLLRATDNFQNTSGTPYIKWIKDSIAENTPYDQMVHQLVSATGGGWQNGAVGYYVRDKGMLKDNMANTTRIFLGTRIECAQCHNHPFDRWTMDDYYSFASFFARIARKKGEDPRERVIYDKYDGETKHPLTKNNMTPRFPGGEVPEIPRGNQRRQVFADWLVAPENPYFARNLANIIWSQMMGQGIVEPVDDVLRDRVCVNRRDHALLDTEGIVEHLDHLCEAVRGA